MWVSVMLTYIANQFFYGTLFDHRRGLDSNLLKSLKTLQLSALQHKVVLGEVYFPLWWKNDLVGGVVNLNLRTIQYVLRIDSTAEMASFMASSSVGVDTKPAGAENLCKRINAELLRSKEERVVLVESYGSPSLDPTILRTSFPRALWLSFGILPENLGRPKSVQQFLDGRRRLLQSKHAVPFNDQFSWVTIAQQSLQRQGRVGESAPLSTSSSGHNKRSSSTAKSSSTLPASPKRKVKSKSEATLAALTSDTAKDTSLDGWDNMKSPSTSILLRRLSLRPFGQLQIAIGKMGGAPLNLYVRRALSPLGPVIYLASDIRLFCKGLPYRTQTSFTISTLPVALTLTNKRSSLVSQLAGDLKGRVYEFVELRGPVGEFSVWYSPGTVEHVLRLYASLAGMDLWRGALKASRFKDTRPPMSQQLLPVDDDDDQIVDHNFLNTYIRSSPFLPIKSARDALRQMTVRIEQISYYHDLDMSQLSEDPSEPCNGHSVLRCDKVADPCDIGDTDELESMKLLISKIATNRTIAPILASCILEGTPALTFILANLSEKAQDAKRYFVLFMKELFSASHRITSMVCEASIPLAEIYGGAHGLKDKECFFDNVRHLKSSDMIDCDSNLDLMTASSEHLWGITTSSLLIDGEQCSEATTDVDKLLSEIFRDAEKAEVALEYAASHDGKLHVNANYDHAETSNNSTRQRENLGETALTMYFPCFGALNHNPRLMYLLVLFNQKDGYDGYQLLCLKVLGRLDGMKLKIRDKDVTLVCFGLFDDFMAIWKTLGCSQPQHAIGEKCYWWHNASSSQLVCLYLMEPLRLTPRSLTC